MGSRDHSETCEVCGAQRGGINDLECLCDDGWGEQEIALSMHSLGANLVVAAALCRAYDKGRCLLVPRWWPGCGRRLP